MENLIKKVYSSRFLFHLLRAIDLFAVAFTVSAYVLTLTLLAFGELYLFALELLLVCFIPFVIVSVMRRIINAPRPYELYSSIPKPKGKKGRSFPSRHAFSAFAIGTALCYVGLPLGLICLALGVCLGACRVLLGIHFVRDVVAGALIGAVSSVLGMLIVNL